MKEQYLDDIREQGFVTIPGLIQAMEAKRLRTLMLKNDLISEASHSHFIYNLQNKDISFYTSLIRQPVLRYILMKCLNDEWYKQIPSERANYILRGLVGRSTKSSLHMHIDSFIPYPGPYPLSLVAIVSLDGSHDKNGRTLVVPGSHLYGHYANQDCKDQALPIDTNPGDVLIIDTRIWHGCEANRSEQTRWTINATFSRWWIKQSYDIARSIPEAFLNEITDEEKSILGFCNNPPRDEQDRINIQGGYELLTS